MTLKRLGVVALVVLAALPLHGENKPSEKYLPAILAVEPADLKAKCVRAVLALEKWQERLKVQNWDINLTCGPFERMPGALGITEMNVATRGAHMWINILADRDPEEIVIHELLHLVTKGIDSERGEEQTVWMLGNLMYDARGCTK